MPGNVQLHPDYILLEEKLRVALRTQHRTELELLTEKSKTASLQAQLDDALRHPPSTPNVDASRAIVGLRGPGAIATHHFSPSSPPPCCDKGVNTADENMVVWPRGDAVRAADVLIARQDRDIARLQAEVDRLTIALNGYRSDSMAAVVVDLHRKQQLAAALTASPPPANAHWDGAHRLFQAPTAVVNRAGATAREGTAVGSASRPASGGLTVETALLHSHRALRQAASERW